MDDNADTKRILLATPPADWRRQLGRPRITWLSTIQQDLKQHHLTLPEAAELAQNRPLWRMMSKYGMPETTTKVTIAYFQELQLFNFNIHPTPKEKNSSRQLQYNNIDVEWGDYSRDRNLCKSIVVPGHILLTILNSVGLLQKQNINIKQF